jgi:superfamily II DNA or RNA helicase
MMLARQLARPALASLLNSISTPLCYNYESKTFGLRYYSYKLRGYQQECIDVCLKAFDSGKRRVAVSLPTGGGKTVSLLFQLAQ